MVLKINYICLMVNDIIISVIAFASGAGGARLFDYFKNKDNNDTKAELKALELKLKQAQLDHHEQEVLIEQNKELISKINHLEVIIERANSSFEMLITLLKEEFKTKPHIIEAFDQIKENLKKKA